MLEILGGVLNIIKSGFILFGRRINKLLPKHSNSHK